MIRKSCALLGAIDLETLQRYLNFHFSVTVDLSAPINRRMPPFSTVQV